MLDPDAHQTNNTPPSTQAPIIGEEAGPGGPYNQPGLDGFSDLGSEFDPGATDGTADVLHVDGTQDHRYLSIVVLMLAGLAVLAVAVLLLRPSEHSKADHATTQAAGAMDRRQRSAPRHEPDRQRHPVRRNHHFPHADSRRAVPSLHSSGEISGRAVCSCAVPQRSEIPNVTPAIRPPRVPARPAVEGTRVEFGFEE